MAVKSTFSPPASAEREYTRVALRLSRALAANANRLLVPAVASIKHEYDAQTRGDAQGLDKLTATIAELERLAVAHTQAAIATLPGTLKQIASNNERQFAAVVKAKTGHALPPVMPGAPRSPIGVNVFRSEPFMQPMSDAWIKANTDMIKSLPTRLHPELEGIVRRGVTAGASVRDIKAEIAARYGMTDYRAKLIAQDQTLKFNADLTRHRLQSVGVERYIWRSVQDSRVRPEHAEYNGNEYGWDDPPPDGNPGQPVRCRCHAEAVWPDEEVPADVPLVAPQKPHPTVDLSDVTLRGTSVRAVRDVLESAPADQVTMIQSLPKPQQIASKRDRGSYSVRDKSIVFEEAQTLLHEYGHHVDYMMGDGFNAWSSHSAAFNDAFAADRKLLGLGAKGQDAVLLKFKADLYDPATKTRTLRTGTHITYETSELKSQGMAGLSDIIDAMSTGAFHTAHNAYGHGVRYYNSDRNARYRESFANLFEMRASGTDWDSARTMFPNMTALIDEVVNGRRT